MTVLGVAESLVIFGAALSAAMTIAWVLEQRAGNASWIDFGWTSAVRLSACVGALAPMGAGSNTARSLACGGLIALWCARLAGHLLRRAVGGIDDLRYEQLRRDWGANASWRMFWFAQAQATAGIPLVLAVRLEAHRAREWPDAQDTAGMAFWLIGIGGAALSDWQLRRFVANTSPSGQVCDVGLWRWSRHPNYFFEWLGWTGTAIIAFGIASPNPFGWIGLSAPTLMYWLLVHVSGIPPLEEHMLRTRADAFRAYQRRTSAFFPFPPRF